MLVSRYRTQEVAFAIVGRRTVANDVAQEAMHRAFRALDAFDPARPLAPWLKRIAANQAERLYVGTGIPRAATAPSTSLRIRSGTVAATGRR